MHKILVIDDEIELATLTNILLKKRGYKVHQVTDPAQSISTVKSFRPDLILLDVRLGPLDGRKICSELKEDPDTKSIKIILYSAYHEHQADYKDYGADDFIGKPFEMELLIEKIHELLDN